MINLNISIIVAIDKNRAIGASNKLLWHLPNDLRRFKNITYGKPIIMGRKTFESIGKPLAGRDNLVITSDHTYNGGPFKDNIKIFNNIFDVLEFLKNNYNNTEIMIIGGADIYKQFLPYTNKIYLTLVAAKLAGDVFFPELDNNIWQELEQNRVKHKKDAQHQYNYSFLEYRKIDRAN